MPPYTAAMSDFLMRTGEGDGTSVQPGVAVAAVVAGKCIGDCRLPRRWEPAPKSGLKPGGLHGA